MHWKMGMYNKIIKVMYICAYGSCVMHKPHVLIYIYVNIRESMMWLVWFGWHAQSVVANHTPPRDAACLEGTRDIQRSYQYCWSSPSSFYAIYMYMCVSICVSGCKCVWSRGMHLSLTTYTNTIHTHVHTRTHTCTCSTLTCSALLPVRTPPCRILTTHDNVNERKQYS